MAKTIKFLNWNVNSVHARMERVLKVLERHQPDVVCFQETKTPDEKFPNQIFKDLGYHSYIHGQKSYNGVCILSKIEAKEIKKGFGDGIVDDHARFIWGDFGKFSVASAYIPNGQELEAPAYQYKLQWFDRLKCFIERNNLIQKNFILTGDFNVAPEDIDVYDPKVWKGRIHFSDPEKQKMKELKEIGLVDTFRHLNPETQSFSWWDYRSLSFPKNLGLRIDFMYATPETIKKCVGFTMDREERKGSKPSDHIPLIGEYKL